jgi:Thaumatin family
MADQRVATANGGDRDRDVNTSVVRCLASPRVSMATLRFTLAVLLVVIINIATPSAVTIVYSNRCSIEIWPAAVNDNLTPAPAGLQGYPLNPQESRAIDIPDNWSGRVWARTGCVMNTANGLDCLTGSCEGGLFCRGSGSPPATLAEFTLWPQSSGEVSFWDVSLVDGFNVPIAIHPSPTGPTTQCTWNINNVPSECPQGLIFRANGTIVGCNSACGVFGLANYCCTGVYSMPSTCVPTSFSRQFKNRCPQAYSYAYDDRGSLAESVLPENTNFAVTFCP